MNRPEHYRRAEEILSSISHTRRARENIAMAQVHATLATIVDGPKCPLHAPGSAGGDWPLEDLNDLEREMLDKAKTGEPVRRDGPFDVGSMQNWEDDRRIRAEVLRHLLVAEQWPVHAKGVQLHGVLINGQLDLESAALRCPLHLQSCYLDDARPVVLTYATASVLVLTGCHMAGLQADSLVVTGDLVLTGTTFTGPVRLTDADITGQLSMTGAQLTCSDDGDALTASGLKVGGDVFLDSGADQGTFTAGGSVLLFGADIAGQLSMTGAQLTYADNDGDALSADAIRVGRGVFLDSAPGQRIFTAAGAVTLRGADITGQLKMTGAQLTPAVKKGDALTADSIKVSGNVFLDSDPDRGAFTTAGAVRLPGADITGQLTMTGAQVGKDSKDGDALTAFGLKVGGNVLLDSAPGQAAFTAAGKVDLAGAQVGGSLSLRGADLKAEAGSTALDAEGIQITRKLAWRPAKPVRGQVNLEGGSVAELDDDWTEGRFKQNGYWPPDLRLDGFIYTTIRADNKAGVHQRLKWIRGSSQKKAGRQRRSRGTPAAAGPAATTDVAQMPTTDPDRPAFASGPYEQLMKMYQQAGDDTAAREVAINQRRDQRKLGNLKWYRKLFNWLLDITIGYGYRTWEALVLLVGLYALVLAVTLIALNHHGAIVPVPGNATGLHPTPSAELCQASYPCFSPYGYAFDTVVPIINVHQADYWRPDASTPWGAVCTWVSSAGTVVGWLLVTLAVAGYTGLARRVDAP
jgi:hypothetical protein